MNDTFVKTDTITNESTTFKINESGKLVENDIPQVDIDRIKLLNAMSNEQQHMFALGLGYYAAWIINSKIVLGGIANDGDTKLLHNVNKLLKQYGFDEIKP